MKRCTPGQADAEILRGALVLDVRMGYEFEGGHIRGALNIPISQLPERMEELPRDRVILVVCNHGNRSSVAAGRLEALGFDARLLDGGLSEWEWSGRRLVPGP
ncbi:rhodanese-like domain-containing protein [Acidipropionibacterium timonense]|uniref:rhodanese-like domain-containing protein n=1 Tax=Acidipropionibacterium timonense TaxID=2161818 RepID=UPI00103102EA|nr:rhodanese-like domain-containing protein [Acidipropionibacterium timonense]